MKWETEIANVQKYGAIAVVSLAYSIAFQLGYMAPIDAKFISLFSLPRCNCEHLVFHADRDFGAPNWIFCGAVYGRSSKRPTNKDLLANPGLCLSRSRYRRAWLHPPRPRRATSTNFSIGYNVTSANDLFGAVRAQVELNRHQSSYLGSYINGVTSKVSLLWSGSDILLVVIRPPLSAQSRTMCERSRAWNPMPETTWRGSCGVPCSEVAGVGDAERALIFA